MANPAVPLFGDASADKKIVNNSLLFTPNKLTSCGRIRIVYPQIVGGVSTSRPEVKGHLNFYTITSLHAMPSSGY